MGGAIVLFVLGTLLAWMLGCIPFHALLTLFEARIPWLLRFLLGMFISGVAVVLLWWASMEYRNGWLVPGYTVIMFVATVVSTVLLIVRWFMRRG